MSKPYLYILIISFILTAVLTVSADNPVITGAERTEKYIPLLQGKRVGIVANQTSIIDKTHLVDSLMTLKINIAKIYCLEHGFRGKAEAGETIVDQKDTKTGIQVISLYGKKKKPTSEDIKGIDIMVFDIQDVGVRFFTYISSMHYIMEACAENNIPFLVLDRPNPNGFYVDGPVLNPKHSSFVGMHPVPVVHGMTIAEYAMMINGEGWLKNGIKCDLKAIKCKNYTHKTLYRVPVRPSPNLPNMTAIYLYPSLGFFEGTAVSIGRGTDFPFQVIGHPEWSDAQFSFTPVSKPGASTDPKHKNIKCFGYDLRSVGVDKIIERKGIYLKWLIEAYNSTPDKEDFFTSFFYKLSGNSELKQKIQLGMDEELIYKSWEKGINDFMKIRKKYLLYEDF